MAYSLTKESATQRIGTKISGQPLLAASLDDIIRSQRAARRGNESRRDRYLERTRDEEAAAKEIRNRASQRSAALKRESDRALIESIRYRLSLAPEKRLNCLRRKIGLRATSL